MKNTLIVIIIIIILIVVFYTFESKIDKNVKQPMPNCLITDRNAQDTLNSIARGCVQYLDGVIREYMVTPESLQDFFKSGNNKLVIVTDVDPQRLTTLITAKQFKEINLVALSGHIINDEQIYIILGIKDGKVSVIDEPTTSFVRAFTNLSGMVKEQLHGNENFVIFIDEDRIQTTI